MMVTAMATRTTSGATIVATGGPELSAVDMDGVEVMV